MGFYKHRCLSSNKKRICAFSPPATPTAHTARDKNSGSVPKAFGPSPLMTSRQAILQEDTFFRVMRILQDNPDLTQRELAEKLGFSVGGLNYCLKAFTEKCLVKMQNFANSKNKFGYVYMLTPSGMAKKAAISHRFLKRKMADYALLKAEIEALRSEAERPGAKETQKV